MIPSPLLRGIALGLFATIAGAGLGQTDWKPPSAPQLIRLERALASWDAQFDPAEQMVRRPFSTPGYHTKLSGGYVHPTRDSLNYALGLLDTGKAENLPRATAIVRRLVALQDADPASPTLGIWSWYLEEPLPQMKPPDWNWADFNGVTLLQIARDHRDRLPADLAVAVDQAILRCCQAIRRRNVGPGYTNISIMGAYVTLVAGELLGAEEYRAYGMKRLQAAYDFTQANGTFEEFNSPTYTIVALQELSRLHAHVHSPEAQRMITPLLHTAWAELARHFHAPSRQWAGPHSRAYSSLLGPATLALVQRATGGRTNFGVDLPDREDLRLPLACPADLEQLFGPLNEPRTVTETFIKRSNSVGTTYLHPGFALGTINHGDLWNQRRALLLHAGTGAAPGYLHLRFLKNGYDFASAWLHSAQQRGTAAGIVNLVTDGGDTHIALDKVKGAKFEAHDLRLRFEFGGPAGLAAQLQLAPGAKRVDFTFAGCRGSLDLVYAALEGNEAKLSLGRDAGHQWIDVILHEGANQVFDLQAMSRAAVGFALAVGEEIQASASVDQENLVVSAGALSARAALKPAPRPFGDYHSPSPADQATRRP